MSYDEDLLFRKLRDINLFAEEEGYGFRIEYTDSSIVPDQSAIEEDIRKSCLKSLPENQFRGIVQRVEDIMEAGGRFIIKDGEAHKTYEAEPDPYKVVISLDGATPYAGLNHVPIQESSLADMVVEWHTHAVDDSFALSIPGDVRFIAGSVDLCCRKPYFHALYLPAKDRFCWYHARLIE